MNDQFRFLLAALLSIVILIIFTPEPPPPQQNPTLTSPSGTPTGIPPAAGIPSSPQDLPTLAPSATTALYTPCADTTRIPIQTPQLQGSIALCGASLDDLDLSQYRTTPNSTSPPITLLRQKNTPAPYFIEHGWLANDTQTPNNQTLWTTTDTILTPTQPLTLTWTSPDNITYKKTIHINDRFLITITQTATNNSGQTIALTPYARIVRHTRPPTTDLFILHEGGIGYLNKELIELDYDSIEDNKNTFTNARGWLGFTDKYWLTALMPHPDQPINARYIHINKRQQYQSDYTAPTQSLAPQQSTTHTSYAFAGAKRLDDLEAIENNLNITHFDLAVDFGWFYFITKPTFQILDVFNGWLGNFGLAILLLTVLFRLVMYPLANKSFRAMYHMRQLQPDIMRLREQYANDRTRLNQEMMAFFQKKKVNPAAGCLPLLLQFPLFFALYKVLFVSIEMRHQPFFGWIDDLSDKDPTNLFNLFGLLPFTPPSWLHLGLWPIIMGATMVLQQKLNPPPTDPIQQKVFAILPYAFTIILAIFPAGLVIYWTWNNMLSIAQQYLLNRQLQRTET
ncbi:MAG: membrane protein insertase YidC [Alphaproteobacteria bacterium GM202ARS2]|nr:membrane protein insertase YidC [Alphaproteobacteria bacterium GM202ARS2]